MPNIFDYLFGTSSPAPDRKKMYEDDHAAFLRRQRGEEPPQVGWDNYAPQQGPSMQAYQDYRQQLAQQAEAQGRQNALAAVPETGPIYARGNGGFTYAREDNGPSAIQQAEARQSSPATTEFPEHYRDWSWWDVLRNPFSEGGEEAYRKARAADRPVNDENDDVQTVIPDANQVFDIPSAMDENTPVDTEITPPDEQTDGYPVQQNPINDLITQRDQLSALYPSLPPQDIGQDAIDAETDKDRQRSNYLAQLAFFSGITQSAGGQWEGVGKGLAGAGQAYTSGFDRYQRALDRKARSKQDAVNAKYKSDVGMADAAVKLYAADKAAEKSQLSETRLAIKERREGIDKYFTEALKAAKNDLDPNAAANVERIQRNWRISRERGEIVNDIHDVGENA